MKLLDRTKWAEEDLAENSIHVDERKFLSEVGLPSLEEHEFVFSNEHLLPCEHDSDFHLVGKWYELQLCVRESVPGIWALAEEAVLVNSSAKSLSQYINLIHKQAYFQRYLPPTVKENFMYVVKKAMEVIDPDAMQHCGVWLPFIEDLCEQSAWYEDD